MGDGARVGTANSRLTIAKAGASPAPIDAGQSGATAA